MQHILNEHWIITQYRESPIEESHYLITWSKTSKIHVNWDLQNTFKLRYNLTAGGGRVYFCPMLPKVIKIHRLNIFSNSTMLKRTLQKQKRNTGNPSPPLFISASRLHAQLKELTTTLNCYCDKNNHEDIFKKTLR